MGKLVKPLQQENTYKVVANKWRNWPDICQRVFNETYGVMFENPRLYAHPKAAQVPDSQWKTTCWNAAWTAADACQKALKDIIKAKGYMREPVP